MRTLTLEKRHFEFIAATLKEANASPAIVAAFAMRMRPTNPKFNRDRFIEAATAAETPRKPSRWAAGLAAREYTAPAGSNSPATASAKATRRAVSKALGR